MKRTVRSLTVKFAIASIFAVAAWDPSSAAGETPTPVNPPTSTGLATGKNSSQQSNAGRSTGKGGSQQSSEGRSTGKNGSQ